MAHLTVLDVRVNCKEEVGAVGDAVVTGVGLVVVAGLVVAAVVVVAVLVTGVVVGGGVVAPTEDHILKLLSPYRRMQCSLYSL